MAWIKGSGQEHHNNIFVIHSPRDTVAGRRACGEPDLADMIISLRNLED